MRGCIGARVRRLVMFGCCALALVTGCGDLRPGQQPGIPGEMIGRDDAGLPDYVVTGSIVAVPKREGMAWFRATYPRLRLLDLRLAAIPFTPRQVRRMGGEVVRTDDGGHFQLGVPAQPVGGSDMRAPRAGLRLAEAGRVGSVARTLTHTCAAGSGG